MKRLFLLITLTALLVPWAVQADELTINDGTTTNSYVPIYGLYTDTQGTNSEFIIPAETDGMSDLVGATINTLTFYISNPPVSWGTPVIQLYIGEVDETTISALHGPSNFTIVATGVWDNTQSTLEIVFDNPYTYEGGNLLIGAYVQTAGDYKTTNFLGVTAPSGAARYNQGSGAGSAQSFLPKVTFDYTPGSGSTCDKPSSFEVSNIAATGATLTWADGSGSYNVEYKKASDSDWTSLLASTSDLTADLTELMPNTPYQARVQSVCGSDVSGWKSASFTTACGVITSFPWNENFERYSSGDFADPCWVNEHIAGTATYVFRINTSSNGGNSTHQLQLPDEATGNMIKLVLPEMNLPGNNYQFVLDVYRNNSTYNNNYPYEGIRVFVSTDGEIEGATELAFIPRQYSVGNDTIPAESAAGWYTYELPLGVSGNCFIILRGESQYCTSTYMDNFSVEQIPSCRKPSAPKCLDKTAHTAKLTWTLGEEGQSAWQIAVDTIAAFDPDTVSVLANLFDAADDTVVISGLRAGKLYYAYVRANCGTDGYSAWSKSDVAFLTASGKAAPTDLAVIEESLTSDEAKVNWQRNKTNDLHQSFDLYYSELNTMPSALNPDSLIENITDTFYLFQKLTHETTYYVWVRDNCGTDGQSAWSSSASFTTLASCAVPGSLSASNITAYTADVAWAIGLSAGYNVQYRTAAYFDGEVQQFGSSIPSGWAQYTGLLSDVMGGTALTTATYGWNFGTGNGVFDNHARVNIYGNNQRWLVTPAIQLAAGAKLTFDLALTAYSGNLAAPATTGVDDKFVVLVSTDDGATWTILRQWDNADGSKYVYNNIACSATGENVTIDLSSYADQSVMIAFYGESTVSNADNNLHIDNVAIGVPIAAGDWQTTSSTEKNVQLASLTPETQYEVQVQGVCGAIETEWSESLFFTTIASCVAPTELAKSDVTAHGATLNWTSDGSAWQIMLNEDEENLINVTEKPYTLTSLAPETAYSAKVRTDCGNEYSDWSSAVSFTTLIACHVPTALAVQLTPGDATVATLSWTAGEEGQDAWQICLNGDVDNLIDVTENPYTLTNLTPETEYTVKIRANCGDVDGNSAWSSIVSFEPTEKIVIGSGSATSSYLPSNTNFDYSLSQQIYTVAELGADAGLIESIDFYMTSATDYTRNLDIYMVSTDKNAFESATDWISVTASNLVFSGEVDFIGNSWTTITLDNGFIYEGLQNVAIVVDDNTGEYSSRSFKAFEAASNQAIIKYQDNTNIDVASPPTGTVITSKNQIRILKGEIPSCFKPSGLAINYAGGTTAEVSWTGEATSFNIDVNGTVTNGVTSPYELSGLELATTYEVKVQADCGSGNLSDWTSAVSFSTDLCMPEDQCILTFELTDSYGDSWNGNAILVTDVLTGKVLGEMANENLNGTSGSNENEVNIKTLSVCNGREIQFSWVKGSYPTETSWVVKDVNGQVLFSGAGTSSMETGAILYTHTVDCTRKFYLAIGTSGYATFYDEDYAYTMPANLSGHTFNAATGLSDAIYEANQIIPAKEPLVMKAADNVQLPDTFILVEAETDALPSAGNDLKGNNEEGTIGTATDGNVYYVLSLNAAGEDESVGFYYMLEDGKGGFTMPAHKAYLQYSASGAPAQFFLFNGENGATWLDNLQGVEGTVKFMHEGNIYILRDSIIYDATGRKVRELK